MGVLFGVCGLIQGAVLVAGFSSSHTFIIVFISWLVAVLLGPVSEHESYCDVFAPPQFSVDIWVSRLRRWNRFRAGHKTRIYNQD